MISAPAIVAIVWGNAPRLTRDIYDMRGYPIIRGVAYVTHRGMVVPCSVAALYRGDSVDYQFLGGYDDDIRADLEWALTPIEAAALDALVAAVVDAVKADTEVVK